MNVRLVCWKPELAQERARILQDAGLTVDASPLNPSGLIGKFRAAMPSAVLIDLDRLPANGLGVAIMLRRSKTTRHIPIVFAGGLEEKVARARQELPDAVFTDWKRAPSAIRKAVKDAPMALVQPIAHMERWTSSPLLKKLDLAPKMRAAVLGAPDDFVEKLGDLPEGLELLRKITAQTRLALWFVRSRRELDMETEFVSARLPNGASLWIIHPKQAGRIRVDFNQNDVRAAGLAAGLVDYKVCAVDEDWSGLKFARKKPKSARA